MLASQGIGLIATLAVLAISSEPAPPSVALVWAAGAGLAGTVGLGGFYVALARGTMGLVAPLAALIGAGLPAVVGVAGGEQPSVVRSAGLLLGLGAVVLISLPGRRRTAAAERALRIDLRDLPLVVVAGLGFAGFYLLIDRALSEGADIWWSIAGVRVVGLTVVSAVLVGLLFVRGRGRRRMRLGELFGAARLDGRHGLLLLAPLLVLAGLGDLGGNGFFIVARQQDLLSVSVVLSSLYPVITTLLAAVLLRERLSRPQLTGVALAVAAVGLIGVG